MSFALALLAVGLLLVVTAALSAWLRGVILSISVLSVVAGVALGELGVVSIDRENELVIHLVELALLLTLFSDGLIVERELVRREWRAPARALVLALPITFAMLAAGAIVLFPDLSLAEALLLAAVLAPTDPVVTSTVVTARRVPQIIRHTLNLESGLNDGLALPLVLVFVAMATAQSTGSAALELIGEVAAGAAIGLALAWIGGRTLEHLPGGHIGRDYEGVYAFGIAITAFGAAELTYGNGLIAAFLAGVGLAVAEREVPEAFIHFNESVSSIFQVTTFFVFGALISRESLNAPLLALAAFVVLALLVARPAGVLAAFAGSPLTRSQRTFVAWFGPKGVASMLFALFVLESDVGQRSLIFDVAAFTVLASIVAHGLTDTVGARWIERRVGTEEPTPR